MRPLLSQQSESRFRIVRGTAEDVAAMLAPLGYRARRTPKALHLIERRGTAWITIIGRAILLRGNALRGAAQLDALTREAKGRTYSGGNNGTR